MKRRNREREHVARCIRHFAGCRRCASRELHVSFSRRKRGVRLAGNMPASASRMLALPSEHRERAINSAEHFVFSEDFEQMIEARAGVAAGYSEPRRMDNRADFYGEIRGG